MSQGKDLGGLTACAAYDHKTNAKGRLAGWGIVSKSRAERKVSRKERRKARGK